MSKTREEVNAGYEAALKLLAIEYHATCERAWIVYQEAHCLLKATQAAGLAALEGGAS